MHKPIVETPANEKKKCRERFENFTKMFTRKYLYSIELMVRPFFLRKTLLNIELIDLKKNISR